jgi:hypothetical protein
MGNSTKAYLADVRTIGLQRAKVKICLMNLVYSMIRLVRLIKADAKAVKQDRLDGQAQGSCAWSGIKRRKSFSKEGITTRIDCKTLEFRKNPKNFSPFAVWQVKLRLIGIPFRA